MFRGYSFLYQSLVGALSAAAMAQSQTHSLLRSLGSPSKERVIVGMDINDKGYPRGYPIAERIRVQQKLSPDQVYIYENDIAPGYFATEKDQDRSTADGAEFDELQVYSKDSGLLEKVIVRSYRISADGSVKKLIENRRIFRRGQKYIIEDGEQKTERIWSVDGAPPRISDLGQLKKVLKTKPQVGSRFSLEDWDLSLDPPQRVRHFYTVRSFNEIEDSYELERLSNDGAEINRYLEVHKKGDFVSKTPLKNGGTNFFQHHRIENNEKLDSIDGTPIFNVLNKLEMSKTYKLATKDLDEDRLRFVMHRKEPLYSFNKNSSGAALESQLAVAVFGRDLAEVKKEATQKFLAEWNYNHHTLLPNGDILVDLSKEKYAPKRDALKPLEISQPDDSKIPNEWVTRLKRRLAKVASLPEKAKILSHFLSEHIKTVDNNTELSLDEVVKLKAGVCRDYSHLAAALLRRLGIPSRVVSGFRLASKEDGVSFGPHAWIEWREGDEWIAIEPQDGKIVAAKSSYFPVFNGAREVSFGRNPAWDELFNYEFKAYEENENLAQPRHH